MTKDGATVGVVGATVDVYRTDISGKLPSSKTDKKGYFAFAGFQFGQTFALAVSGAGISPTVYPNVKAGMQDITITVSEGSGAKLTEEQVRAELSRMMSQSAQSQGREPTAEEKKAAEDQKRKYDEAVARNEKAKKTNEIVMAALTEGSKAFTAKDFDLALAKFEEGYQADPEFAGSAPVFLNNKALVFKDRAFLTYKKANADPANKASLMESAKTDFSNSIEAAKRAIGILKGATSTDPNEQKGYKDNLFRAYSTAVESYRLIVMTNADTNRAAEAPALFEEYLAIETDQALKEKTELTLANILRESGDCVQAAAVYRKITATAPENPDALAGLGLCLFSNGVSVNDKAQMQEGLNIMQRFAETAPDTHPLKQSVKDAVDYLLTQEKLTPQKAAKPSRAKKP
jgi:tetratricopeptide (TPR) repeat protein